MSKKAILVVSFGTSHRATRAKTIQAIEKDIKNSFLDYEHYSAWTSGFLAKKEGKLNVSKACQKMLEDGVRELVVIPTHFMKAFEYEKIVRVFQQAKSDFESVVIGSPLIADEADVKWMQSFLTSTYVNDIKLKEDEALILMGHGTSHEQNIIYEQINDCIQSEGKNNIFIATVEAKPGLDEAYRFVQEKGFSKVCLAPFMIVAGDHAAQDLYGDGEDSWRAFFQREKIAVRGNLKGLGEYSEIREKFVLTSKLAVEKSETIFLYHRKDLVVL